MYTNPETDGDKQNTYEKKTVVTKAILQRGPLRLDPNIKYLIKKNIREKNNNGYCKLILHIYILLLHIHIPTQYKTIYIKDEE